MLGKLDRRRFLGLSAGAFATAFVPKSLQAQERGELEVPAGLERMVDIWETIHFTPNSQGVAWDPRTYRVLENVPGWRSLNRSRRAAKIREVKDRHGLRRVSIFTGMEDSMRAGYQRFGGYDQHIQRSFDAEGVPLDARLLTFPESFFRIQSRSRAAAVGPYQFIASTARMVGGIVGTFVDERKDPVLSGTMAAKLLRSNANMFGGNWYAAINAYNTGPGNVRRAIRRARAAGISGTTNRVVWANRNYRGGSYRFDSAHYLSRVLSVRDIDEKFSDALQAQTVEFDAVELRYRGRRGLRPLEICRGLGIPTDALRELNPAITHSGWTNTTYLGLNTGYELRLPSGMGERFLTTFRNRLADGLPVAEFRSNGIRRPPQPVQLSGADRMYEELVTRGADGGTVSIEELERVRDQYALELEAQPDRERYFNSAMDVVTAHMELLRESEQEVETPTGSIDDLVRNADTAGERGSVDESFAGYKSAWLRLREEEPAHDRRAYVGNALLSMLNQFVANADRTYDPLGGVPETRPLSTEERETFDRAKSLYEQIAQEAIVLMQTGITRADSSLGLRFENLDELLLYTNSALSVLEGREQQDIRQESEAYDASEQVRARDLSSFIQLQYQVQQGDTLETVAGAFGISGQQVREWNGIQDVGEIGVNDVLDVYVDAGARIIAPKAIQRGENLTEIARRYGDSTAGIQGRSAVVNPNRLMPGDQIYVNMSAEAYAANRQSDALEEQVFAEGLLQDVHYSLGTRRDSLAITVQRGQTYSALSRRYGIPTREIMAANSRTSTRLLRGEQLVIPLPHFEYAVRPEDNPTRIAEAFDVSVGTLYQYNPGLRQRSRSMPRGMKVIVPVE